MASDLNSLLDDLYFASLADFVQRRGEAVKTLKAEGRKEEAARIKALKKPSTAAWVVNQLHFLHRVRLEELTLANEAIRQAHGRAGQSLPEVMTHRLESLDRLMTEVRNILTGAGLSATREQLRRIHRTLEAATAPGAKDGPGRLAQDLEPTGFGALTGLSIVPRGAETTPRKTKPKRGKPAGPAPRGKKASEAADASEMAKAQASAAIKIEQARLERAEREVRRAEAAYLAAERHIRRSEAKITELEERVENAKQVLTLAKDEAAQKEHEFSEARESLERARSRVREATRASSDVG